jgi:hypothetical protein
MKLHYQHVCYDEKIRTEENEIIISNGMEQYRNDIKIFHLSGIRKCVDYRIEGVEDNDNCKEKKYISMYIKYSVYSLLKPLRYAKALPKKYCYH